MAVVGLVSLYCNQKKIPPGFFRQLFKEDVFVLLPGTGGAVISAYDEKAFQRGRGLCKLVVIPKYRVSQLSKSLFMMMKLGLRL